MLLGCATAHELGHLLIGSTGPLDNRNHAAAVAATHFRQFTTNSLLFTPEPSQLMRKAVRTGMDLWTRNFKDESIRSH